MTVRMGFKESDFDRRFQVLRESFRNGRYQSVEQMLLLLASGRIPHEHRTESANIARRSGYPLHALKLLRRGCGRGAPGKLIAPERAEYAASLAMLGSSTEAHQIFDTVDSSQAPETPLLRAIAFLAVWEHESAIPHLERYLGTSRNAENRIAAELRLAACLLRSGFEGHAGLGPRIEAARREAERLGLSPQWLYATHLMGEYRFAAKGDLEGALGEFELIRRRFPAQEALMARTWTAVLGARIRGDGRARTTALESLRKETIRAGDWITARLHDLCVAAVLKSSLHLERVFFGSPFPGFRRFALLRCGAVGMSDRFPDWHELKLGVGRGSCPVLDVARGAHSLGQGLLREESVPRRLLGALASDFYRPIHEAELHERLYPGDRYDPGKSGLRVRVAVLRLREWLGRERLPLVLEALGKSYRLDSPSSCVLRIPHPDRPRAAPPVALARSVETLFRRFGPREFTSRQVAAALGGSVRSANLLLLAACSHALILKSGGGPSTRFRIVR